MGGSRGVVGGADVGSVDASARHASVRVPLKMGVEGESERIEWIYSMLCIIGFTFTSRGRGVRECDI